LCVSIWAISTGAELGAVMLAASACFIAVTAAGLIAGVRLLPRGLPVWYGAVGAAVATSGVLLFSGVFLAVPASLAVAALLYITRSDRRRGRNGAVRRMALTRWPTVATIAGDQTPAQEAAAPSVSRRD
jgi:hypothetical protein